MFYHLDERLTLSKTEGSNFFLRLIASLLSVGLIVVAFPSDGLSIYLSWICFVPWILSLYKSSIWQSLLFSSLITMAVIVLPSYTGINNALIDKRLSDWGHIAHLIGFYLPYFVTYMLVGWFIRNNFALSFYSLVKTAAFATLAIILMPVIFPLYPAHMLSNQIIAIQLLDIGGTPLLQFLQLFINLLIAIIIMQLFQKKGSRKQSIALILSLALIYLYGYFRINHLESIEPIEQLNVLTVQANSEKYNPVNSLLRNNNREIHSVWEHTRHAIETAKNRVDLILWPETSLKLSCNDKHFRKLAKQIKALSTPILYQCEQCDNTGRDKNCHTSAQFINAAGQKNALYYKQSLIPAFEYLISDMFSQWKYNFFLAPQENARPLLSATIPFKENSIIIPSICYDIHFADNFFSGYRSGGNLIMNMGNDAAFGQSQVARLDVMMTRFRIIEFRLALVRANNNGLSLVMNPSGEIQEHSLSPMKTREARLNTIKVVKPFSLYAIFGDWFLNMLIGYFIGLFILKYFFSYAKKSKPSI